MNRQRKKSRRPSFIRPSKTIQYLGINLTKETKDLFDK
jgi:hypothetical protein